MSVKGKEYKLAIRIAGTIDKTFNTSLAAANNTLKKNMAAIERDFARFDKGFDTIIRSGKRCFSAVAGAASIAALAIGAAVANCTKEASKFEHQMADVTKYVNGLADAAGRVSDALALDADGNILNGKTYKENYQEMKSALLDLSKQIPMTAEELTQLAAAAGQSGYDITDLFQYDSNGNLTGFLKDTAVMGTAMDISAAQAGDWAAKWEKAFNMTHDEIMVLADQINYLGANSATTAAEIAQVVNDSASLGQIAGIDVSTTAALADAMLATGVGSDKVATSIKRTITNLVKGTSATKAMKEQWAELGFTANEIAMDMQEDSIGTLNKVFEAIGNLPDYKQVAALSTLFGQWAIEGDAKIVGNMKVFQDALDMVSDPSKYSGSMEREFVIKASTSESIDTMVSNAFRAMKISIGDSFLPIKKEYSQKLIDFIDEITEKMTSFNTYLSGANGLSKWMQNAETQFPTFQRKFKKFAQPVFSGIMNGGKWIIKHGKGIISVLTGIGAALAVYKAASTIVHIVNAIMSLASLNPVTLGILGVVSAIGLLVGAFTAYKQYEQGLIDQSLAEHFGSIELSMEELQKVAEYIISSESLGGVKKALEAFQNLDTISATMQDAVSEINKLNWKISIGMELTEDENETYKQAIDTYIKTAQDYALQSQYAVSLNLQIAFSDADLEEQNVVTKVNQFYQDKYNELSGLGTQLNNAITDAFNDGLLDIKETKVIAKIQAQMAEIEESLATGEFDAQLSILDMEYANGASLTADSFQNLQEKIAEQVEKTSEAYQESYVKNYAAIQAAHKGGYLNKKEFDSAIATLESEYLSKVEGLNIKAASFQIDTIMNAYGGDIMQAIEETIDRYRGDPDVWDSMDWSNVHVEGGMSDNFIAELLPKGDRGAIRELMEYVQPLLDMMKSIQERHQGQGEKIPADLEELIRSGDLLNAVSSKIGDAEQAAVDYLIGTFMSGDEYYEGLVQTLKENGSQGLSEALLEGMTDAAAGLAAEEIAAAEEIVKPVVENMYTWSQGAIDECYGKGFQTTADVMIMLNPIMQYGRTNLPALPDFPELISIDKNADGGIIRNKELSWLAEEGPEAVIPLDGSRNAVSLWEKAGKILGMDNKFDHLDLGGGDTVTVLFNPVLNFYGEAPSKDDLIDAIDISQDKFDKHMEQYFKFHARSAFR